MYKVETMSTSSLSTYQQCPLMYKFKYIDKLPIEVPKNNAAVLGTGVHLLFENFYIGGDFRVEVLRKAWPVTFEQTCIKEGIKFSTQKQKLFYLNEGYKVIEVFYKAAKQHGLLKSAIYTEKYFKVKLKDFFLTGRIDLIIEVENELLVLDYKSSKYEDSNVHKNKQLTFYSWAMAKQFNLKESRLGLFYVRTGNILYSTRKREDYLELAKEIIKAVKSIRQGKFTPTFNCKFCEYPDSCRNWINCNRINIDILQDEL